VFAGVCPEVAHGKADSTVATAWWCSGSTYRGTVAHELGHTWGLPHPDAFLKGFRCADSTAYSIMQCHWWWEKEKVLDYEAVHLRSLDFFQSDTAAPYVLLANRKVSGVRCQVSRLESGDSLIWVDGRGAGTAYPWAIVLDGAGALASSPVAGSTLALDLGLERGSTGEAELRIEGDGKPLALLTATGGHAPQRVVFDVHGVKIIRFKVARAGPRARVVLGNARVYR
jgi:hypothetical protein